jgi:hypothetical protein
MRVCFGVLLLAVCLAAGGPAGLAVADEALVERTVLTRAGEPGEVRGPLSRIVGLFEREGDRLRVTLSVTGHAPGQVMRTGALLVDGQRLTLRHGGTGRGAGEIVEIRRRGAAVVLSVSAGSGSARAAPQAPGAAQAVAAAGEAGR